MKRFVLIFLCSIVSISAIGKPIVIAHRGASAYLPEHTLPAVVLAAAQGADYIEQDLVLTKDHIPVVLHDIHIDTTTNVAELFPNRKRDDGRYYAIDFTLKELKRLRVHERKNLDGKQVYPNRYRGNANYKIATFEEQIELIEQLNRQLKRNIGLYPEIKAPAWHKQQGADISNVVLTILRKYQLDDYDKPIFLQCFDFNETKRLRNALGAQVKLIQLIGENSWQESTTNYDVLKTTSGLNEISKVAQGIGPWIPQLIDINTGKPTLFAHQAKDAGLMVHPYTFRFDSLPDDMPAQILLKKLFIDLEIDGIFTDFPDQIRAYVDEKTATPVKDNSREEGLSQEE
ncbi:glycerophosphoryl diester phosphodiesterase [Thalassotalea loyana]|uniref:glycerophosphodiester phosphodiesterase n=1 Tax=Thalassotalea loyana TaxID=280483 RepID=A0ABQ6HEY7_9GAMM|nr:glycerophosphodiester phosphodiesterase [Thalassotalea loyana]GLX86122.1 glycerophosphoryl diester phosphodiesterase [Thalassotalea loyana]